MVARVSRRYNLMFSRIWGQAICRVMVLRTLKSLSHFLPKLYGTLGHLERKGLQPERMDQHRYLPADWQVLRRLVPNH